MDKEIFLTKKITAIIFAAGVIFMFFRCDGYSTLLNFSDYLKQDIENMTEEESTLSDKAESSFVENMPVKDDLVDVNGAMARRLGMRGYYNDEGLLMTKKGYVVGRYPQTSTDYEYEEMCSLYSFCKGRGVNLLYVNLPIKYIDDDEIFKEFGEQTFINQNADELMKRIREAGIPTVDLRDHIREEGIESYSLFYRTDHHWTVPAGLWASGIIAEGLNDYCGYDIDLSIYDENNYEFTEYDDCWLGEQGRKLGAAYTGLEDFTEVKPLFDTSFTFYDWDGSGYEDDFSHFIDETVYSDDLDVYDARSWHYSYSNIKATNNNEGYGKLLLLCDSYMAVGRCFLNLGIHDIDSICLREYKEEGYDFTSVIEEGGYDTVVIAYAEFVIGAHDDTDNSNYGMFDFGFLDEDIH